MERKILFKSQPGENSFLATIIIAEQNYYNNHEHYTGVMFIKCHK